jgi:hypothetical protein
VTIANDVGVHGNCKAISCDVIFDMNGHSINNQVPCEWN